MLTAEYLRSRLDYNRETGAFTWKYCADCSAQWNGKHEGREAGNLAKSGYVRICIDGVSYRAHRLAWLHVTGVWPFSRNRPQRPRSEQQSLAKSSPRDTCAKLKKSGYSIKQFIRHQRRLVVPPNRKVARFDLRQWQSCEPWPIRRHRRRQARLRLRRRGALWSVRTLRPIGQSANATVRPRERPYLSIYEGTWPAFSTHAWRRGQMRDARHVLSALFSADSSSSRLSRSHVRTRGSAP